MEIPGGDGSGALGSTKFAVFTNPSAESSLANLLNMDLIGAPISCGVPNLAIGLAFLGLGLAIWLFALSMFSYVVKLETM